MRLRQVVAREQLALEDYTRGNAALLVAGVARDSVLGNVAPYMIAVLVLVGRSPLVGILRQAEHVVDPVVVPVVARVAVDDTHVVEQREVEVRLQIGRHVRQRAVRILKFGIGIDDIVGHGLSTAHGVTRACWQTVVRYAAQIVELLAHIDQAHAHELHFEAAVVFAARSADIVGVVACELIDAAVAEIETSHRTLDIDRTSLGQVVDIAVVIAAQAERMRLRRVCLDPLVERIGARQPRRWT